VFTGCASVAPIKPESAAAVRNGATAVVFYDAREQINYIEDKYFVLGVAQVASNSAYRGLWDSNRELSALHADELRKTGLKARSIYDILSEAEITEAAASIKVMYEDLYAAIRDKKPLTPSVPAVVSEMLLANGYDHLMCINWSGYTLHLQALGLPPLSKMVTGYTFFNLHEKENPIWDGSISTSERTTVEGDSGKIFLESNDLLGLRKEVGRLYRIGYGTQTPDGKVKKSVGQLIGLEPESVGK
jgi:hypothetical protein